LTGEKLSEYQAIRAVESAFKELRLPTETFTLAPIARERPPHYVLLVEPHAHRGRAAELASRLQTQLERINQEYSEKCASGRLRPVEVREVPTGTWDAMRHEKSNQRGNYEEYKHSCLVNDLEFVDRVAKLKPVSAA
jgi:hypothetical protein